MYCARATKPRAQILQLCRCAKFHSHQAVVLLCYFILFFLFQLPIVIRTGEQLQLKHLEFHYIFFFLSYFYNYANKFRNKKCFMYNFVVICCLLFKNANYSVLKINYCGLCSHSKYSFLIFFFFFPPITAKTKDFFVRCSVLNRI